MYNIAKVNGRRGVVGGGPLEVRWVLSSGIRGHIGHKVPRPAPESTRSDLHSD